MKKYFFITLVLSLVLLPSCFKKEIKNLETVTHDQTEEEKNINKGLEQEFDGVFKPCYYWELNEEKTTNVN